MGPRTIRIFWIKKTAAFYALLMIGLLCSPFLPTALGQTEENHALGFPALPPRLLGIDIYTLQKLPVLRVFPIWRGGFPIVFLPENAALMGLLSKNFSIPGAMLEYDRVPKAHLTQVLAKLHTPASKNPIFVGLNDRTYRHTSDFWDWDPNYYMEYDTSKVSSEQQHTEIVQRSNLSETNGWMHFSIAPKTWATVAIDENHKTVHTLSNTNPTVPSPPIGISDNQNFTTAAMITHRSKSIGLTSILTSIHIVYRSFRHREMIISTLEPVLRPFGPTTVDSYSLEFQLLWQWYHWNPTKSTGGFLVLGMGGGMGNASSSTKYETEARSAKGRLLSYEALGAIGFSKTFFDHFFFRTQIGLSFEKAKGKLLIKGQKCDPLSAPILRKKLPLSNYWLVGYKRGKLRIFDIESYGGVFSGLDVPIPPVCNAIGVYNISLDSNSYLGITYAINRKVSLLFASDKSFPPGNSPWFLLGIWMAAD